MPAPGSEGAPAARGVSPPSLGSVGPARAGVAVGKTCWVSSHVFPRKTGPWVQAAKWGEGQELFTGSDICLRSCQRAVYVS